MNIFSTGLHLCLIVVAIIFWKFRSFPSNSLVANHKTALVWLAFMFVCAVSLYCVLERWSSPSVRDDFGEVSFYLIFLAGVDCVDAERVRVVRLQHSR